MLLLPILENLFGTANSSVNWLWSPHFDAVGTPFGTKYIFSGGLLWELTKTKADVDTYLYATKTGWENHPAKPREDLRQSVMH